MSILHDIFSKDITNIIESYKKRFITIKKIKIEDEIKFNLCYELDSGTITYHYVIPITRKNMLRIIAFAKRLRENSTNAVIYITNRVHRSRDKTLMWMSYDIASGKFVSGKIKSSPITLSKQDHICLCEAFTELVKEIFSYIVYTHFMDPDYLIICDRANEVLCS